MLGAPAAGGMIGTSLAGALSKWLGAGDYNIGTNSVVQRSLKAASSIPSMHSDAQSIVVRHKEYLGEVKSSVNFSVQQSFPLNPGAISTFPWLSGIANRFQEYRIRGAVFHYIPTSGSAVSSTNAALGSVMLQTSYRTTDNPPESKVEMLNEYCSNEVVPCEAMAHPIECDPKENPFNVQYVRTGPVPAGETALMYDLGQTHLAVSGCQTSGFVIGDLWVTYEIELKKPLIASNVTSNVLSCTQVYTTGLTAVAIFGTSTAVTNGPLQATTLLNTITFPKGSQGIFYIFVGIGGNTLSIGFPGITTANCTQINTGTQVPWINSAGSSLVDRTAFIRISDPSVSATVTFTTSGGATAVNFTNLVVAQMA